jgi:hypothetical protein
MNSIDKQIKDVIANIERNKKIIESKYDKLLKWCQQTCNTLDKNELTIDSPFLKYKFLYTKKSNLLWHKNVNVKRCPEMKLYVVKNENIIKEELYSWLDYSKSKYDLEN